MASLTKAINKNLFDKILPTFGTPRVQMPVWDEGQKMFLCGDYESASGHRYYMGVRFCDHIDSIEVYAFNGTKLVLVQKRDYEKSFRSEEFIRQESVAMVRDFIEGVVKAQGGSMAKDEIETQARSIVESCYKSFLDSDFNTRLTKILPQIEQK